MLLYLLSLLFLYTHALNLETKNPKTFSGPKGSYFGFSIDVYEPGDKGLSIVVGAPKANTSQPGVTRGGSVFLCPWQSGSNECSTIPFDQTGDIIDTKNHVVQIFKSDQWLGATVRTWDRNILACAPLQHFTFQINTDRFNQSGKTPTGACYLTTDLKNSYEFAPCRELTVEHTYALRKYKNDTRDCELGFSAEISKTGTLLAGAPTGFYFDGLFMTVPLSSIPNAPKGMLRNFRNLFTSPDFTVSRDAYQGFSVAYGEFSYDDNPDLVIGIPNYVDIGAVQIYTNSRLFRVIRGKQVAAYFGYAVAVTDIDKDGYDDLLVGAPLFLKHHIGGKLQEVGQVYVFMQKTTRRFGEDYKTLSGNYVYGQFGASIAPLGDLDLDGYNDVAVGSPFGGKSGGGCVYIFKGERSGLSTQPSQILENPLYTPSKFGFTLRGGKDIDGNGYPDLIVGAFGADAVYVYRAQPVVALHTSITFSPNVLNPDVKTCTTSSRNASCFDVIICVQTSGKNLPKTLNLLADIQLDSQKNRFLRRTLFLDSPTSSKTMSIEVKDDRAPVCSNVKVYLKDESEFKDKLSPIVVSVNFSLAVLPTSVLPPIIHGNSFLQEQIHILLDCGIDNICIPDLHLTAQWNEDPLVIGIDNLAQIHFHARNHGEGAYEAELHIWLPSGAHYMQVLSRTKEKLICAPKKANETELVICELGNPMKYGAEISAALQLTISNLEESGSNISFPMQIKSRNSQNSSSPIVWVNLDIIVKMSLDLRGSIHPAEVILPLSNWELKEDSKNPGDRGVIVTQIYELHNGGPGTVHVQLVIQSPEDYEEEHFLYPFDLVIDDNMKCSPMPPVNTLQLMYPTVAPVSKADSHRVNRREAPRDEQGVVIAETENQTTIEDSRRPKIPILLNCHNSTCWKIKCVIQNMEKGRRVTLKLDSVLWVSSFLKRPQQQFTLRSNGYFNVTGVPYRIQPPALIFNETSADLVVQWVTPDGQKEIPLWWIILGALGGLLILALFIFVMWKLGFFQRNRPPTEDEDSLTSGQ
ncbi:integrin alpha-IIb [Bufo gargarizans]|uniref:integrin alpha-IIb n=1 Tax=Bufo gargarizans TaxID=30331 RepID=UPI001CF37631|nr:integrin alpha-IIb [Bufo gargarizans]XP_044152383.1 integrin alpha-IIb [Bufo gargarizans]